MSVNILDAIGGLPRPETDTVVEATAVEKWFGKLHVLKGVSLTVKRREVVVVIGASGSGKTTFIRCINHLEKIQKGRIFVNGHLIGYREESGKLVEDKERNIAKQRQEIGMVFQRFNLFPHMTVLDNITEAPMKVRGVPKDEKKASEWYAKSAAQGDSRAANNLATRYRLGRGVARSGTGSNSAQPGCSSRASTSSPS